MKFPWRRAVKKAVSATNNENIPIDEIKKRKRERILISTLGIFFCLLTYVEIHISNISQKLPFVNSIFFFGLVNFNVALLLFLAFLIFRNIAKIFSERRGGVLGSKLKTKLVMAFVSFAFVPTILLFLVSVFYINSSFDKWFSLKISGVLQDSLEVTNAYYTSTKKKNYHFAYAIAQKLSQTSYDRKNLVLEKARKEYSLDAVEYYPDIFSKRFVFVSPDSALKQIPPATLEFLQKGIRQGIEASTIHQFPNGNLIRCIVPIRNSNETQGVVVVSTYVPLSLVSKMDGIATAYEDYRDVNPLKYPLKSIYMIILILVTLIIFFGASWFGFHLARQLSTPLELLGRATEQVAHGYYQHVNVRAGSLEMYQLIESFNKMTNDLKDSEQKLRAHSKYIEVVLSHISAGVVSVDNRGCITTINNYAAQLLGIQPQKFIGKPVLEVLTPDQYSVLQDLMDKITKHKAHSIQKEFKVSIKGEDLLLQLILSPLKNDQGGDLGYVLAFDDLTKLVNAQRAAAWREVARRIAHEIKNPLTPIKLSAERLQKKFGEQVDDPAFITCTQTIIQQVDELKELVNEFSSFARLPQARLSPNELNQIIDDALVLYKEGHKNIKFEVTFDSAMPAFDIDRDQIKRVFMNLFDNAVSALEASTVLEPTVAISTHYDSVLRIARCIIADNGMGIPLDIRDRIFEPYFSTKDSGTGLGLAIVKRIIDDHNGFIRVFKNLPVGSKFVVELPVNLQGSVSISKDELHEETTSV